MHLKLKSRFNVSGLDSLIPTSIGFSVCTFEGTTNSDLDFPEI